jgi:hypothetical protein
MGFSRAKAGTLISTFAAREVVAAPDRRRRGPTLSWTG